MKIPILNNYLFTLLSLMEQNSGGNKSNEEGEERVRSWRKHERKQNITWDITKENLICHVLKIISYTHPYICCIFIIKPVYHLCFIFPKSKAKEQSFDQHNKRGEKVFFFFFLKVKSNGKEIFFKDYVK